MESKNRIQNLTEEDRSKYIKAIMETTVDGFWVVDMATRRMVDVNRTYCRMSGYSREEFLKLSIEDIDAVENPEETALRMESIRKYGSLIFETRHRRKEGSLFDVEISVTYLDIHGGLIICFCRDISERKKAEADKAHTHDLLRYIIEHDRSAIAVHDRDLNYIYVSRRYLEEYRVKEKDIIGKHHYDVFPDLPSKWRDVHLRALKGEVIRGEDDPFLRGDGTLDWTRWECRPWFTAEGTIGGIIVYTEVITERKQMAQALKSQEKLLRNIIDTSTDMIYVKDPDLKILLCNRQFSRHVGREPEDLTGKTEIEAGWDPRYVKGDPALGIRGFEKDDFRVLAGETIHLIDEPSRVDNEIRLYDTIKQPLRDETGEIIGILGISRDITEQKKAKQEKIQQHELLTNLARQVPGVIYQYRLNPDGTSAFPYASPGMNAIYEVTPEEVREDATPVFGRLHPEDAGEVSEAIFASARTLEPFYAEFRVILPRQGLRWRWSQALPVRTEDGGTLWHGIILDVTDRKKAEEAIREERERLAVTLRSIGDGVITTDSEGRVMMMNRVAEGLTGWTQGEARGRALTEVFRIVNETTRHPLANPVEKVLATGEIIELENHTLLIARDGKERVIADSGAPIKDARSITSGVVLVFRDVTEKHKLQDNMQRIDKLESLGVLAGGIAHDFNNLLGGIFGYIDMARATDGIDPSTVKYLDKALGVFERARDLTQQLLIFSKGGSPRRKTGRLESLIKENAEFVLAGTNVKCLVHLDKDLWLCDFDENQMGQVIDNLVINARQAMEQGGIITLKGENLVLSEGDMPPLKAGPYLKISISDSGSGIPPELQKRIFDPFFTTKTSGSGLGLATCYSIIQKHDGLIDVESLPQRGSTFHIYLPASKASEILTPRGPARLHFGEGDILVMDDESFMREIVGVMLTQMGYTYLEAENGESAIQQCRAARDRGKPVRAVLLDLTIPGSPGGKEVIGELHREFPGIPVFAASGFSEDPIMAHPGDYGFTDSIRKPFRMEELAAMLDRHLSG